MHRIVKTGYIDMAHRIRGHKGKCCRIHGHTWKVELSVSCSDDQLDDLNMVLDFKILKEEFFIWLDEVFDHTFVINPKDHLWLQVSEGYSSPALEGVGIYPFPDGEMTAETFSKYLYNQAIIRIQCAKGEGCIKVDYVRVYEQLHPTESYAEYTPD